MDATASASTKPHPSHLINPSPRLCCLHRFVDWPSAANCVGSLNNNSRIVGLQRPWSFKSVHPSSSSPRKLLRAPTAFAGLGFYSCLSVFPHDISKPIQLGSSNSAKKCSTMSPGNPFTLASKGQRSSSSVTKIFPPWVCTVVSAGFFQLWKFQICRIGATL